ncbi:glutathione S- partial [Lentinula edodes]|uniref:Glutathione S-partial n=1 Tax=Lentinula edodes TaxID=5353 RepID=A0A1Q3E8U3_LENED|nr:glutathione S- partial [Lentinula edodes]
MSDIPKAVLYYYNDSIWSCAVLLALEEKGYGEDEVVLKVVDLAKGENYGPKFLRLNSKATVPTLVVPLDKSLSVDVESRYKAITETKTIIEFLDKSRSPLSHTNTTSQAPAPILTPATIDFAATCKLFIEDLIHSEDGDPNNLLYMNARDEESLRTLADSVLPLMKGKVHALNQCLSDAQAGNIRASDKVVKFWTSKKEAAQMLLEVYENAKVPSTALDASAQARREEYFKVAKASWEVALVHVLTKLNEKIIGPYTLGEQYSIADPHLTAWLARVVMLAGGSSSDNGNVVIEKLEKHIGSSLVLPNIVSSDAPRTDAERSSARTKLGIYWDTVKERSSWKKVYGHGLH